MNLTDAFPSRFLKASDLPADGAEIFTIEKISLEQIGADKEVKPVIFFEEESKGLVLNKTNGRTIARILQSQEFDDWLKHKIGLYRADVEFRGELVEAIRIKAAKQPEQKPAAPQKPATVPSDELDEEGIPF